MCVIMVPGIDGSDSDHWQSHWEHNLGDAATRIEPTSWTSPDLDDWCAAVDRAVDGVDACVLVAHSLGCLATVAWLSRPSAPKVVAGVLLVAPPDVDGPRFPLTSAPTFVGLPQSRLPVPALVLASSNDPFCSTRSAAELAARWDAPLIDVGGHGHINSASGVGAWQAGWNLATAFSAGLGMRSAFESSARRPPG